VPTLDGVYREALSLSPKQRGQLISRLVCESLPPLPSDEEMNQRLQDVLSGRVTGVPVAEAMQQARLVAGLTGAPPEIRIKRRVSAS
jgi:hypothetical protein